MQQVTPTAEAAGPDDGEIIRPTELSAAYLRQGDLPIQLRAFLELYGITLEFPDEIQNPKIPLSHPLELEKLVLPEGVTLRAIRVQVQLGDTWESLALRYGSLAFLIQALNTYGGNPQPPSPGDVVEVPQLVTKEGEIILPKGIRMQAQRGDTFEKIAKQMNVSVEDLRKANPFFGPWPNKAPLPINKTINIPFLEKDGKMTTILPMSYTVKGDITPQEIADIFGIPVGVLYYYNKITTKPNQPLPTGLALTLPMPIVFNKEDEEEARFIFSNPTRLDQFSHPIEKLLEKLTTPSNTPPVIGGLSTPTPENGVNGQISLKIELTVAKPETVAEVLYKLGATTTMSLGIGQKEILLPTDQTLEAFKRQNPDLVEKYPDLNWNTILPSGTRVSFKPTRSDFKEMPLKDLIENGWRKLSRGGVAEISGPRLRSFDTSDLPPALPAPIVVPGTVISIIPRETKKGLLKRLVLSGAKIYAIYGAVAATGFCLGYGAYYLDSSSIPNPELKPSPRQAKWVAAGCLTAGLLEYLFWKDGTKVLVSYLD